MKEEIKFVTRKYLEGKTLIAFSCGLGIKSSRQMVWMWKSGQQVPSMDTLFSVISSPMAEPWARAWAGECLSIIRANKVNLPASASPEIAQVSHE